IELTDEQKEFLISVGIDPEKITPESIQCAIDKIGENRVEEIKNGDAITLTDVLKVYSCFQ
ncbi:hypothetical protein D6827_01850, partial [Candidatus Parcubacteria bacterium]